MNLSLDDSDHESWIGHDSYSPQLFNILRNHFNARGHGLYFEVAERNGTSGYLISGDGETDIEFSVGEDRDMPPSPANNTRPSAFVPERRRPNGKEHDKSPQPISETTLSWLSALSDHMRPLSQFSYSSDRVRLRLAGDRFAFIRSSDGFHWESGADLMDFRAPKASDEAHPFIPALPRYDVRPFEGPPPQSVPNQVSSTQPDLPAAEVEPERTWPSYGLDLVKDDDADVDSPEHNYANKNEERKPVNGRTETLAAFEIFKSFKADLRDPCYRVLPAVLRHYGVKGDWRDYELLIIHGNQERRVYLEEKPLAVIRELDRQGKRLMLILRKITIPVFARPSQAPGLKLLE